LRAKLSTEWTKHLKDEKAREDFAKLLLNSTISLGRLREILEERLEALQNAKLKTDHYDVANWAYMQADSIGAERTLKKIIELLEFTKKGR
jgi:hypothetical protein